MNNNTSNKGKKDLLSKKIKYGNMKKGRIYMKALLDERSMSECYAQFNILTIGYKF